MQPDRVTAPAGPERIYIGCVCPPEDGECGCEQRWSVEPWDRVCGGRSAEYVRRDLDPDAPGERIWLSPACDADYPGGERLWCEEDMGECPDCGAPSVAYVAVEARDP